MTGYHQTALWAAQSPPLLPRCSSLSLTVLQCVVSGSLRTEPSLPGQLASGQAHRAPPALPASTSSGPAQPDWSLRQLGPAAEGRARTQRPHVYPPLPPATAPGDLSVLRTTQGRQSGKDADTGAPRSCTADVRPGHAGADPRNLGVTARRNGHQLLPSWEEQTSLGSPREQPQAG